MDFNRIFINLFSSALHKLKKPVLVIVCGPPGVGKSTTSKILAKEIKGIVLTSEKIIKEFYGNTSNLGKDNDFNKEEIDNGYNIMNIIAEKVLKCRRSVVLDGVFRSDAQRNAAFCIANRCKVDHHLIYVTCPEEIVKERITKRFLSGIQPAGYKTHMYLKSIFEPIACRFNIVDTSKNIKKQIKLIVKKNCL